MTALFDSVASAAPFVTAWSLSAFAVTLLLTVVAIVLHHIARGSIPHRLVWGVTIVTAFAFTAMQPWRRVPVAPTVALPATMVTSTVVATPADLPLWQTALARVHEGIETGEAALTRLSLHGAAAVRRMPLATRVAVVLLWPIATLTLLFVGVWSYRRQRAVLRDAARVDIHGHTLFVSDSTGPAVFGVRRPRIVVPAWFLQRTEAEQQLVVAHEQSHIAAHDPALLLSACMLTALTPLNPCAWYLFNRLRLAIELDCDARVLQGGAVPRHYGALLIDLSAAATPAPLLTGAAAFSHHASHLERRLRFMTDRPATHTTARRLASLSLGTLAIIAACGAELPTSAELQGMDVASAEKRAFVTTPDMTAASYTVDGKAVSEQEAKAIKADRIASIEIQRQDKKRSLVRIKTQKPGAAFSAQSDSAPPLTKGIVVAVRADGTADSSRTIVIGDTLRATPLKRAAPLVFLDGVKATEEAMKMSPDRIERIEVIKGAAAEKLYGPEGANGVIVITTKK